MVRYGIDTSNDSELPNTGIAQHKPCRVKYVKPEIDEISLELEGPAFLAVSSAGKEPDFIERVSVDDEELAEDFD